MENYRLYKGAWISIDESKERLLTLHECNSMLQRGGVLVRNVYNFDIKKLTSFWYVIKDSFEEIEELAPKVRRDIRRSFRCYDFIRISYDTLLNIGYPIYVSAQSSYKVKCNVVSYDEFVAMVDKYQYDCNKEFWGVRQKETGEFVALAINTIKENSCEYNVLKCKVESLKDGSQPYYGLIYEMNRYYLQEKGLYYVNDGARSITNHSNIQNYLEQKFRFRRAYCDIKITYKWWLKLIVKVLYPFRNSINRVKVKAILNMEAMQRGEI